MAKLNPSQLPGLREDGGLFRELDVLECLRSGLPDGYEIFHEVTWHSIHEGVDRHGEVDIVVLSPDGSVLLIEVKAGQVLLREGGIFKRYGQKEKDVARQCRVQYAGMVSRLKQAGLHPYLANCLVLPDYQIPAGQVVSIPRERIITADEYSQLTSRVQALLATGSGTANGHGKSDANNRTLSSRSAGEGANESLRASQVNVEDVRRFLCNEFQISPSIAILRDQLHGATQRLSDGLAVWVPRISSPSGIVRIQATAGSGKTQLALRLLEDAAAAKLSALYVCYNRPLSDAITVIAPARATISCFHELAVDHYRRHHGDPDFSNAEIYQLAVDAYHQDSERFTAKYDLLIIDEGQDFDPQWVASLMPLLKPSGRLYLMEDEAQRLYDREAFDLPDAVMLNCNDNFRSPGAVCQVINALELVTPAILSKSPYQGDLPEFLQYDSEAVLIEQTDQAVKNLLAQGFALTDIVILTGHGRGKSRLLNSAYIGRFATRRFTGKYTRDGDQVWSDGELMVESIFRFKGQSAPAIILSELDFTELTAQERRKLFVGMTRAQLNLQIILSQQAAGCIGSVLG